ncbi:hypothetical protein SPHINGOT1_40031 [Sphingomonas sp. T1]|nr:hypothetical protein SPHINGOT1_40031 [Sphingomonas sp. T1]
MEQADVLSAEPALRADLGFQLFALARIVPQLQVVGDPADHRAIVIAGQRLERRVHLQDAIVVGLGHDHRHRRHLEHRGEMPLARLQRMLRAPARLEVGEGEQQAVAVADLDRLPGKDDQRGVAARERQLRLELWHDLAARDARLDERLALDIGEKVEIEQRLADDRVAVIARQVEKPLIDQDETLVGDADDQRGGGIGMEHRLEPVLRVEPLGHVADHQREAVGLAAILVHDDVTDLMDPAWFVRVARRDLDDQVGKALAREQPEQRIFAPRYLAPVAVAQGEPRGIIVRGRTQLADAADAVHLERSGVGAQDHAGRVDQDHPFEQSGHELFEMVQGGRMQRLAGGTGHASSALERTTGSVTVRPDLPTGLVSLHQCRKALYAAELNVRRTRSVEQPVPVSTGASS